MGRVTLLLKTGLGNSPSYQVQGEWKLWHWRYNDFSLSRYLLRPHNQKII